MRNNNENRAYFHHYGWHKVNKIAINDQLRMKDGFIILKVNDKEVKSVDEMKTAVGTNKSITISGFYPGYDGVYEYPFTLDDN